MLSVEVAAALTFAGVGPFAFTASSPCGREAVTCGTLKEPVRRTMIINVTVEKA
ncbi:MAG: hypothetical protein LBB26_01805 [Puniceicoccales bacterium]|nr:hypothetical protein [Puniceicoccales bacterium]